MRKAAIPLERIDSTGFMIGNTGTNYYRKTSAWKGMLMLMIARGGWINTIYGNLEFLDDDARRGGSPRFNRCMLRCRPPDTRKPSAAFLATCSLTGLFHSTPMELFTTF